MKAPMVILSKVKTTLGDGLFGCPRRLDDRKNERFMYSQCLYATPPDEVLIPFSFTNATDTELLRVVMAAVEGSCLFSTPSVLCHNSCRSSEWVFLYSISPSKPLRTFCLNCPSHSPTRIFIGPYTLMLLQHRLTRQSSQSGFNLISDFLIIYFITLPLSFGNLLHAKWIFCPVSYYRVHTL